MQAQFRARGNRSRACTAAGASCPATRSGWTPSSSRMSATRQSCSSRTSMGGDVADPVGREQRAAESLGVAGLERRGQRHPQFAPARALRRARWALITALGSPTEARSLRIALLAKSCGRDLALRVAPILDARPAAAAAAAAARASRRSARRAAAPSSCASGMPQAIGRSRRKQRGARPRQRRPEQEPQMHRLAAGSKADRPRHDDPRGKRAPTRASGNRCHASSSGRRGEVEGVGADQRVGERDRLVAGKRAVARAAAQQARRRRPARRTASPRRASRRCPRPAPEGARTPTRSACPRRPARRRPDREGAPGGGRRRPTARPR